MNDVPEIKRMETLVQQRAQVKLHGIRRATAARLWKISKDQMQRLVDNNRIPEEYLIEDIDRERVYIRREFVARVRDMTVEQRKAEFDWWPRTQAELTILRQKQELREQMESLDDELNQQKAGLARLTFGSTAACIAMEEFCVPFTDEPVSEDSWGVKLYHPIRILLMTQSKHSMNYELYPIHKDKALKALFDAMVQSINGGPNLQFESELASYALHLVTFRKAIHELLNPNHYEYRFKIYATDKVVYADQIQITAAEVGLVALEIKAMFEINAMQLVEDSFKTAYPFLTKIIWPEQTAIEKKV
jgi:hypothetical protein